MQNDAESLDGTKPQGIEGSLADSGSGPDEFFKTQNLPIQSNFLAGEENADAADPAKIAYNVESCSIVMRAHPVDFL